jgi:CBS domain-containing protein
MTTRVIALREKAEFKDIVCALRRYRVSACPVLDDADRVVGVVSEADLLYKETDPDLPVGLTRLSWRLAEECKATAVTADALMTTPAITIGPAAPLCEAARLMQSQQVKRLPVVNESGRLVGIVTRSDVLAVFERPDADIWDEVVKVVIGEQPGLNPDSLDVTVSSGVVTICGQVDLRRTALTLLARVRHVEGVIAVRDRMSYPSES